MPCTFLKHGPGFDSRLIHLLYSKSMLRIAVIDGKGGGIGSLVAKRLRVEFTDTVEIIALGTNAAATATMMKARADKGATGENAIAWNAGKVDVIIGTLSVVLSHAMLGELSPPMAEAVSSSKAGKILLPLNQESVEVVGVVKEPLPHMIENMIEMVKTIMQKNRRRNGMCEANAYIYSEGREDLYLENVDIMRPEEGKIFLKNLFGEQKVFEGTIKEVSLLKHKIILEKK
jgi:predicted RNA-binding protein